MDEHLFSVKAVKSSKNENNTYEDFTNFKLVKNEDSEPLTTKNAVKFLLEGSLRYRVCRYCLHVTSQLSEPDEIFEVARKGAIFKVTLRDMIACVHPFQGADDPNFPDKICSRCVENAISSYLFSQQCERSERALRNCFADMHEKFEKLDPIERGRKRGRQKANPNPNVLYTEHQRVDDYAEPIINIINIGSTSFWNEREINELECPKCWQILPNVESLLNHENLHPKSMWYSCRLCGQSFVKHRQYKKHIKELHIQEPYHPEYKNTSFKCNDCGFSSYCLSQHLRHMEKHKFKTTFEHLIDRSMNRLCSVCLDKGSSMIHLNETVDLNGGYPGLTDEKTIRDIVSSTFPERKSYKYQELVIPMKAKIVTMTRRTDCRRQKNITALCHKDKINLPFCDPIIVSTRNIDIQKFHRFILSPPCKVTEVGLSPESNDNSLSNHTAKHFTISDIEISNNVTSTKCSSINRSGYEIDDNLRFKETIEMNECQQSYSHVHVTDSKLTGNPSGSCKSCWIFKRPSCQTCLEASKGDSTTAYINMENTENQIININQEMCKYCWIFKNVGKCDYCEKIVEPKSVRPDSDINVVAMNNVQKQVMALDITERQSTHRSVDKLNPEFKFKAILSTRKRKLPLDSSIPRKPKWICHICLTNNDNNRETCFCCEFDKSILRSTAKFNFGMIKHSFKIFRPQNDKILELGNALDENPELVPKNNEPTARLPVEAFSIPKLDVEAVIHMDVEIPSFENQINLFDKCNKTLSIQESMDVSYDVFSEGDDDKSSPSTVPFQANISSPMADTSMFPNTELQFNIGSSCSNNDKPRKRRIMRPLRRMANIHK